MAIIKHQACMRSSSPEGPQHLVDVAVLRLLDLPQVTDPRGHRSRLLQESPQLDQLSLLGGEGRDLDQQPLVCCSHCEELLVEGLELGVETILAGQQSSIVKLFLNQQVLVPLRSQRIDAVLEIDDLVLPLLKLAVTCRTVGCSCLLRFLEPLSQSLVFVDDPLGLRLVVCPEEGVVELCLPPHLLGLELGLVYLALEHSHLVLILLLPLLEGKIEIGHVLAVAVDLVLQGLDMGGVGGCLFLESSVVGGGDVELALQPRQLFDLFSQLSLLLLQRLPFLLELLVPVLHLVFLVFEAGNLLTEASLLGWVPFGVLDYGQRTLSSSATRAMSSASVEVRLQSRLSSLFLRRACTSRLSVSSFFFSSSAILTKMRFMLSERALLLVSFISLLLYINSSRQFLSGRLTGSACSLCSLSRSRRSSCSRSTSSSWQRRSFSLTSSSSLRIRQATSFSFSPEPSLLSNWRSRRLTSLAFSFSSSSISILNPLHWISRLRYLSFSPRMASCSRRCSSKACLASRSFPASSPSSWRTFSMRSLVRCVCFSFSRRAELSCCWSSSCAFCMALRARSCCWCSPPLPSAWLFSSWIVFFSKISLFSSSSIFRMLFPITISNCFFYRCNDSSSRGAILGDCASLSRSGLLRFERTELETEDSDSLGLTCWSQPRQLVPRPSSTGKLRRISYSWRSSLRIWVREGGKCFACSPAGCGRGLLPVLDWPQARAAVGWQSVLKQGASRCVCRMDSSIFIFERVSMRINQNQFTQQKLFQNNTIVIYSQHPRHPSSRPPTTEKYIKLHKHLFTLAIQYLNNASSMFFLSILANGIIQLFFQLAVFASFLIILYNLLFPQFVTEAIQKGFSHATCAQIHSGSCNAFCLNYVWRVAGNTYKTYGAVYLVQLLFKIRKMSKSPLREGLRFLAEYVKSTSLTAVQMMLMRRILCWLCSHYRNGQNNLIAANFLSAFYILVESPSRQAEIALYQLNNTIFILYKMAQRRGIVRGLPQGECLLFAAAIALTCFHFFDNPEAFRKSYIQSIFKQLLNEE